MPIGQNESGVTSGVKFVTSTVGNTVGGVTNTLGGVVGALGRGVGETVSSIFTTALHIRHKILILNLPKRRLRAPQEVLAGPLLGVSPMWLRALKRAQTTLQEA